MRLCLCSTLYVAVWGPGPSFFSFFFFNDTAPTEIYTLSLHDALPIFPVPALFLKVPALLKVPVPPRSLRIEPLPCTSKSRVAPLDLKSPRLNSSHSPISHAVFFFTNNTPPLTCFYPSYMIASPSFTLT